LLKSDEEIIVPDVPKRPPAKKQLIKKLPTSTIKIDRLSRRTKKTFPSFGTKFIRGTLLRGADIKFYRSKGQIKKHIADVARGWQISRLLDLFRLEEELAFVQ